MISKFFNYRIRNLATENSSKYKHIAGKEGARMDEIYKHPGSGENELDKNLKGGVFHTFSGVLLEKDILTLPQLVRALCSDALSCFARSLLYLQYPINR